MNSVVILQIRQGLKIMSDEQILLMLRDICLKFPEARETVKWGNPTFEAGKKMFAVLDHYDGSVCVAFRSREDDTSELTKDPTIFQAPYGAKHGWWCIRVDKTMPRRKLASLVETSYRSVAIKRMLTALDNQ